MLPLAATSDLSFAPASFTWLLRLLLLLAIPLLLRLLLVGLVAFAIRDGLYVCGRAIRSHEPDVVLAFSWGGGVALWLLAEGLWRGPTLLLAPTVQAMARLGCCSTPRRAPRTGPVAGPMG